MLLDLNNAASIVEWWCIFPERHGPLLADWERRRPEHAAEIGRARRLIKADPARRALLARSQADERRARPVPEYRPSFDEVAAGELRDEDSVDVVAV
ncbi:hypothetical protein PV762_07005 [Mitsuaria sp. CC2]|jgi:hypothetical protein|uniref:hypothetical protein n=1 Tax=Mitsuaria sp. CC2 TaxID=3029186 RepID=UPI00120803AC|nr:MAG: hypothetical protein EOP37_05225 [Rubrivivax sp.]